jgi:ABC-type antimicrobial peptide transport system permease subunit
VAPIRAIVRDLDPDQAVPDGGTWQTIFGAWIKAAWLGMDTLGAMGVLGLVLALVGLYGLVAYEVSARTREIGIRMALGARAGQVVRMVVQQGIALACCGVSLGVGLNYGVVKLLEAFVGTGSGDAAGTPSPNGGTNLSVRAGSDQFGSEAFMLLVIAVLVITIIAAYLPARRAAKIDPNVSLKAE